MNTQPSPEIERFSQLISQRNSGEALQFLATYFRQQKSYSELFEILKAQIRFDLGLSVFPGIEEELPVARQRELEDRLLEACREVGTLLVADGQIEQSWHYLQPLPDRKTVQSIIESVHVDDSNISQVIEVALCQWAAPKFGYELLLNHQGTCNGITFFDTQITFQSPNVRNPLAETLIDHVYRELTVTLQSVIAEKEPGVATSDSLIELIENRNWLFENCGHHLDVTHLASAVRIGKYCDAQSSLQQALELCQYGNRLDEQLCYPDEPPFESTFKDHKQYYYAVLDIDRINALNHFRNTVETANDPAAVEACTAILVELYSRTGNSEFAINLAIDYFSQSDQPTDIGMLINLAKTASDHELIISHFKTQNNLIGFALAGLKNLNHT